MTEWLTLAKNWLLTRPDPNAIAFHLFGFAPTVPEVFMTVLGTCAAIPFLYLVIGGFILDRRK